MIERSRRLADLDGAPRAHAGHHRLLLRAGGERGRSGRAGAGVERRALLRDAPRHAHQPGATKVGNRRCEALLREAELWWASGGEVPAEVTAELDELWKEVLLQQFHDIIPGSSITWVHEDSEAAHAKVTARLEELIDAALARLAAEKPARRQRGHALADRGRHRRRITTRPHHHPGAARRHARGRSSPRPVAASASCGRSRSTTRSS